MPPALSPPFAGIITVPFHYRLACMRRSLSERVASAGRGSSRGIRQQFRTWCEHRQGLGLQWQVRDAGARWLVMAVPLCLVAVSSWCRIMCTGAHFHVLILLSSAASSHASTGTDQSERRGGGREDRTGAGGRWKAIGLYCQITVEVGEDVLAHIAYFPGRILLPARDPLLLRFCRAPAATGRICSHNVQ